MPLGFPSGDAEAAWCWGLGDGENECLLKGYGIFFWGSENILKLLDSDGFIYCE